MKRTTEADVMISTECKESKQCAPAKHHYDECVERVTSQEADGGAKEDCVEECKSNFADSPRSRTEEEWFQCAAPPRRNCPC